jgi:hypothetical protein
VPHFASKARVEKVATASTQCDSCYGRLTLPYLLTSTCARRPATRWAGRASFLGG